MPHLSFLSPLWLGFLVVLPVLWWLLRLLPPTPRKVAFPALMLLRDLATSEKTPAHTPWWILLLRLLISALVIAAFAGPVIDPQQALPGKGDLLLVVDNDWAAASVWDKRQTTLHELIRQAEREDRNVILLPTTEAPDGNPLAIIGPLSPASAYGEAERIAPQPWRADRAQATALLKTLDRAKVADAVWLASGTGGADAQNLYAALADNGGVRVFADKNPPLYLLDFAVNEDGDPTVAVMRAVTDDPAALTVAAVGKDGDTLAHLSLNFTAGAPRAYAKLDVPLDVRNRITSFEIEGPRAAASTFLLDSGWERRPVGLVGDNAELEQHSLLSGLYYLDRALKPYADLHIGTLDALLKDDMAVIALTDDAALPPDEVAPLLAWIKRGGVLVRFAGERLAAGHSAEEDALLPVALRADARAMGGAVSWGNPQKLRAFPAASPFHGLALPEDVTIGRQILAEPSADLAQNTWADLADGTPLVTGKPIGQGLSILFHVPASSGWSSLPLSGLFVDMLRRIVDLSRGTGGGKADFATLSPLRALDGFGNLQKPGAAAAALSADDLSHAQPGPSHPAGLYGADNFNRALNLGPTLAPPLALSGVPTESFAENRATIELGPYCLLAALIFFLGDFILGLYLRGLLVLRGRTAS